MPGSSQRMPVMALNVSYFRGPIRPASSIRSNFQMVIRVEELLDL
jgi:hypothetical protein